MRKFTKTELENTKGPNGKAMLVAVNGKVYDTSSNKMWKNGVHVKSHRSGQDLSLEIQAAPHGLEVLRHLKQVGVIVEEQADTKERSYPPLIVKKLLQHHPHPMTVHFPIVLSLIAGVFMLAYIVFDKKHFEIFTLYCVIIAALSTPGVIGTGLLSWKYNYNTVWTPIYRRKIFLSLLLFAMQASCLVIRIYIVNGANLESPAYWLYTTFVLGMTPTIILLGYLGGKITFPS
ncbi:MAG: DUF2231 domain-containing protein [Planctomycetota bacterium]|jgi:predicted heme/steroid binding protein/uncharacterized membrane protein